MHHLLQCTAVQVNAVLTLFTAAAMQFTQTSHARNSYNRVMYTVVFALLLLMAAHMVVRALHPLQQQCSSCKSHFTSVYSQLVRIVFVVDSASGSL